MQHVSLRKTDSHLLTMSMRLVSVVGNCFSLSSVVVFLLCLMACSSGTELTAEKQAACAAKGYYDALIYGQPEQWVAGHSGAELMSSQYRQLLLENARMYLEQQRQVHGGITEVSVCNGRSVFVDSCAVAMLSLSFADATNETVAVPMVCGADGIWRMK